MLDTFKEKKNILVVDDDSALRGMIVDALKQTGDFGIQEAGDGAEALKALKSDLYDLVISDVQMPNMTGMELLSKIREINPNIYVIMITAFPSVGLSVSAMQTGAVDFLPKPFNIDELTYKVQIYLREKTILSEEKLRYRAESLKLSDRIRDISKRSYIYDAIENTAGNNDHIFQGMVDLALKIADGERCALFLYDEDSGEFHPKIVRDAVLGSVEERTSPMLLSLYRQVVERKEPLLFQPIHEGGSCMMCVPLTIRSKVFGILSLTKKKNMVVFSEKDLHYILSLTRRASLNLENRILYESLYDNITDTFKALVGSIQVRDHYTELHSAHVTNFALRTAESLKCASTDMESLKIAAMLHDIGKIAIPDAILLKPAPLTAEEHEVIKRHCQIGDNILAPILLFEAERKIIRHHHERWDGKGYPDGLSGEQIPFFARLLAVADAFDAMTTDRPYRKAMTREQAIDELRKYEGRQFDPKLIQPFIESL
ncbi:MAG TPA: response regulator [Syntrophales bacterium]|nr:response regulator [Syntrophales bacterium]